jgi:SAM-dependent methyltransferase
MDDNKITAFQTKMFGLMGNVLTINTARLGKELGLFEALRQSNETTEEGKEESGCGGKRETGGDSGGPGMTSADLARQLQLSPRHVYEWCLQMTGAGFLEYAGEETDKFILPREHASILCIDEGIAAMIPALSENTSHQYPLLKLAYQNNGGILWGDMKGMTQSAKLFFKPVYEKLLPLWIDLSPELKTMLSNNKGCQVADIGCGCGVSTRSLAKLFPNSTVHGYDYDAASIQEARLEIEQDALDNAEARLCDSHQWVLPGEEGTYDVVTIFDAFHDMGDPRGVAEEVYKALKPGGLVFLIEPYSSYSDATKDRIAVPSFPEFQSWNVCFCTPCGMTVPGKEGFGTTAGTERYVALFENDVGFSSMVAFGTEAMDSTAPTSNGFRLLLATK